MTPKFELIVTSMRSLPRTGKALITGKWTAGRVAPHQQLCIVDSAGVRHTLHVHDVHLGLEPPEVEIEVGQASPGLKLCRIGSKIEA